MVKKAKCGVRKNLRGVCRRGERGKEDKMRRGVANKFEGEGGMPDNFFSLYIA